MATEAPARKGARKTAPATVPAVSAPAPVEESIEAAEERIQAEWAAHQQRKRLARQLELTGGKTRVLPPDGMKAWSRGEHRHAYHGEPIECADCAGWVASMSAEERISTPALRRDFDAVNIGIDPMTASGELVRDYRERRAMYKEAQEAASWRLV